MKSVPDCKVKLYFTELYLNSTCCRSMLYFSVHILLLYVCIYNLYTPSLLSLISYSDIYG